MAADASSAEEVAGADHAVVERMRQRLEELTRIGAQREGGVSRLAYGPEEREAHELLARWAREDGAETEVDAAGNTIVTHRPGTPYFLIGSHLDSVVQGGDYDGTIGVISGLEIARQVRDRVEHGVRVVAFAGEEGARFGQATIGSSFAAGLLDEDACVELRDGAGVALGDAAREQGRVTPWLGPDVACFFEIHIEQGRRLESGAVRIGLVDTIAGAVRLRFDIRGRADHSGATPMRMREDALAAASEIVLVAERVARAHGSTVATVGRLNVTPNNLTTVPAGVALWMDIRDVDADLQRTATDEILAGADEIGRRRPVRIAVESLSTRAPVVLHAWPRAIARDACAKAGVAYDVLPSGAGHDAAIAALRAPVLMVFIPCVDGISHSPMEKASVDDAALAVRLVCDVLVEADGLVA
jgi:allantoate deiminase